jgi:3',5'-nucleoside bisphosphate phosphatase
MFGAKGRYPEVDLHCHTTASDGLLTPWELVKTAAECGLKAVGITDHDTMSGWEEAEKAGIYFGVDILKGIELNTDWSGIEVHILGYELDPHSTVLQDKLRTLRDARLNRMVTILEKLRKLGIYIQESEISQIARGESVGRPHIAQALINRGIVGTIKEAFDCYIGSGGPAYVPRYKLSPEEGIVLVREAGGVAVLAHPGVHCLERGLPLWIDIGLQGVEVSHSEHTPEDEKKYRELAERYNLIMTGGSDYHGEARKPGIHLGGWGTSYEVVDKIRKMSSHQHFRY